MPLDAGSFTIPRGMDPLALIGTTIAEKYALGSVVGEGGFAIVYRATHLLWKRPVAVKVFKALGEVAEHDRQRLLDDFIQEGRLLAELSERSSAIVQARDVGMLTTKNGETVPYMVLEWLEGKALDTVLADERTQGLPLRTLDETVRLLDPVAEALALAHKKGVAHRDVKPANVFVLGDPRSADVSVKLLDFGIAKVVLDAQKMGFGKTSGALTSFTPSYGAAEQFNRAYGATGPWTDVFALALVCVETLTGREPLQGETLVQLAHAASDPKARPTPRHFGLTVTDDVEAIFAKALAVKPDDRYATAGDFWTALRSATIGQPRSSRGHRTSNVAAAGTAVDPTDATVVAPPSFPEAPKKKAPLVAIAVVLGIAGIVGGFALRSSKKKAAPPAASITAVPPAMSAVVARCPNGMKLVAGGAFFMGSDEKDSEPNEKPPHRVVLAPFCLDELEVTVERYKACSDRGNCLRAAKENTWPGIKPVQTKIYDPLCTATDPVANAKLPINCINWEQARKFCEATGGRLPTEAEWEFAARGSDGRIYPWGDEPPNGKLLNACGKECVAWMTKHPDPDQPIASMFADDDGFPTIAPVGSFPKGASTWGILDIVGNVSEWVADWYGPYPSDAAALTDPHGPDTGKERVIRGGAWNGASAAWVRPAYRFRAPPDYRTHGIGFRCARSL
jgi:eukaryotic-like serine/threonine-protein kinase